MTKSSAGQDGRSQASGRGPEREKDEFEAGTSYQPSTNQARDEPLPASHHDDGRQEEPTRAARLSRTASLSRATAPAPEAGACRSPATACQRRAGRG